jgi:hypothetical protein
VLVVTDTDWVTWPPAGIVTGPVKVSWLPEIAGSALYAPELVPGW